MRFVFSFMLFFCLISPSCRKDEKKEALSSIEIGNPEGLAVTPHSNVTAVDLDHNGSIDLTVLREQIKIMGPFYSKRISLICSDPSIRFNGFLKTDTLFSNRTITYSSTKINDTILQQNKTILVTHTCNRISPADELEKITPGQAKISFLSAGEQVGIDALFVNGNFVIYDEGDWVGFPAGVWPDTTTYNRISFLHDCDSRQSPGRNFLCFVITSEEKNKFGWIKFNDSGENIIETAISR